MIFLYFIILNAVLLLAMPFIFGRSLSDKKFRKDIKERLSGEINAPDMDKSLWIHASSVGETRVALTLWKALEKIDGIPPLVLSTFTESSYQLAIQENLKPVFRLPPDHPIWINPLIKKLNPSILILIESEFWPCLLWRCAKLKIPVLLANGRISERSYQRYSKVARLFRKFIEPISFFAMRSQTDTDRIVNLGISKTKTETIGNIKFDASTILDQSQLLNNELTDLNLTVFGSTRPGEEETILQSIKELRKKHSTAKFALAPRHINRRSEIENLFSKYDLPFTLQSEAKINFSNATSIIQTYIEPGGTVLVDTLGDLNDYYKISNLAFVGGGFNPEFGGQNILEPAALGKPVIFGPHMKNFEEEAKLLSSGGGGIQLDNIDRLTETIDFLMNNKKKRATMGSTALKLVESKRGALKRHIQKIIEIIS
jgi:3-deoxy-D-manno-octulosonic-acid transferase